MKIKHFCLLITVISMFFLSTSCPAPLKQDMLNSAKDEILPEVTILSPEEGSFCAKTVIVSGQVSDKSTEAGDAGKIAGVTYEIVSGAISGSAEVNEDGTFSFEFSTLNLGSSFVLRVTAEDWNGNIGEAVLNLLIQEGDDIPSFSAVPGNHKVTLTWEDVPNTENYTLYYTTEGSQPSEYYGESMEKVTSPYIVNDLENGNLHVFTLCANSSLSEGPDNWSGYVSAIPLSSHTLAPVLYPEPNQIKVTWPDIPGSDEYEVWRSSSPTGDFILISGVRTGNVYIDKQARDQAGYYYKVKPHLEGSIFSDCSHGVSSPFPGTHSELDSADTLGNAYAVDVQGNYAYAASGTDGLNIFDISNPEVIKKVKTVPTSASPLAMDVAVFGSYAYTADGAGGLCIINISNPAAAYVAHTVPTTSNAFGVAVSEDLNCICVATKFTGANGLDIINIPPGDITDAAVDDTVDLGERGNKVRVQGDYAYVATSVPNLSVVDINSANTVTYGTVVGTVATPGVSTQAHDVALSGGYAYVAYAVNLSTTPPTGLQVVDISTPSSPLSMGSTAADGGYAKGVSVKGGFAYVAAYTGGLQIFNVADPAAPAIHEVIDASGSVWGTSVSGDYIYCANGGSGIQIFEYINPTSPHIINSVATPGTPKSVKVSKNYAFVADNDGGLHIIDISNPMTAEIIKTVPTDYAYDVAFSGDYAFVADNTAGFKVLDISEPRSAEVVKTISTDGWARRVAVYGDYAYVADFSGGLQIIDISVPKEAYIAKTVEYTGAQAEGIAVAGDYAYVADYGLDMLQIIDISDIPSAEIVNSAGVLLPYRVSLSGNYAIVGNMHMNEGIQIIDVSNPPSAAGGTILDIFGTTGGRAVPVSGDYVFLAAGYSGMQVVDLTDHPEEAELIRYLPIDGTSDNITNGADSAGRYVYLANYNAVDPGKNGLLIVDLIQ